MKCIVQFENRASSRRSKHEGESSTALCDRPSRTRESSQRQLPTDQDYAVSTREYQTDQSSLKPAPAAAGSVLGKRQKQQKRQKQPHRCAGVDRSLHIRAELEARHLVEICAGPPPAPAPVARTVRGARDLNDVVPGKTTLVPQ